MYVCRVPSEYTLDGNEFHRSPSLFFLQFPYFILVALSPESSSCSCILSTQGVLSTPSNMFFGLLLQLLVLKITLGTTLIWSQSPNKCVQAASHFFQMVILDNMEQMLLHHFLHSYVHGHVQLCVGAMCFFLFVFCFVRCSKHIHKGYVKSSRLQFSLWIMCWCSGISVPSLPATQ